MDSTFEKQHKEQYFVILSTQLEILLEKIKSIVLDDADYKFLSQSANGEVVSYIRDCLIAPLIDARKRLEAEGGTMTTTQTEVSKKILKGSMAKKILIFPSLNMVYNAIKEVPTFDPAHYEKIVQVRPDIIDVLTDFTYKLEKARGAK